SPAATQAGASASHCVRFTSTCSGSSLPAFGSMPVIVAASVNHWDPPTLEASRVRSLARRDLARRLQRGVRPHAWTAREKCPTPPSWLPMLFAGAVRVLPALLATPATERKTAPLQHPRSEEHTSELQSHLN